MSHKISLSTLVAVVLALAICAVADARGGDEHLLATYAPVLQFDPLEQFRPTRADAFVRQSALEQLTATGWAVVDPQPEPRQLPGVGTGTWRLDERSCTPAAPLGGLACYAAAALGADDDAEPTVYGRITHEDGETILQYWLFYYDDVYSYTYPPSDLLWQAHEGDWENVTVVLSADEQPLVAGYSEHCVGRRRAWIDTPRVDETHPVVHVALGSHANYFTSGTHPIDVACIPPPAVAILTGNHLPLPVDFAFAGPTSGEPDLRRLDDEHAPWLAFPGFWGELQYFHAPAPVGTVPFGTSPVGPAFHAVWSDPLGTLATWPFD